MKPAMDNMKYAKSFKEQLTFRGIIIGAIGAVIITTSSMYVALRMGALPWPTIFCCSYVYDHIKTYEKY
ncbi:hypothetical protein [Clostridium sp. Cult1]|uniref:hypothetical protein n=1 Tax=Clostridium sp. Cult1 TaxID=2079002 RepID=UPI001F491824|nr:hypothetical protein [Clostridium sp. Cult1]